MRTPSGIAAVAFRRFTSSAHVTDSFGWNKSWLTYFLYFLQALDIDYKHYNKHLICKA